MPEEDLLDAKVAAAEARTDAKFAELRGEVRLVNAKLDRVLSKVEEFDIRLSEQKSDIVGRLQDHRADIDKRFAEQRTDIDQSLAEQRADIKADFRANRTLMIGLAVSVSALMLAIVVAVFTVGNTMFSRGMSMREMMKAAVAEVLQQQRAAAGPAVTPPP